MSTIYTSLCVCVWQVEVLLLAPSGRGRIRVCPPHRFEWRSHSCERGMWEQENRTLPWLNSCPVKPVRQARHATVNLLPVVHTLTLLRCRVQETCLCVCGSDASASSHPAGRLGAEGDPGPSLGLSMDGGGGGGQGGRVCREERAEVGRAECQAGVWHLLP